jgi:hypothetical protein
MRAIELQLQLPGRELDGRGPSASRSKKSPPNYPVKRETAQSKKKKTY